MSQNRHFMDTFLVKDDTKQSICGKMTRILFKMWYAVLICAQKYSDFVNKFLNCLICSKWDLTV